jgi:glutamate-ammonia-ligase adenylyltransferase
MTDRTFSVAGSLARLGFDDVPRVRTLLEDPALAPVHDTEGLVPADLVAALGETADPDLAVLGLVRLVESLVQAGVRGPDGLDGLVETVLTPRVARDRVLSLLGASTALVDHLVRHPTHWTCAARAEPKPPETVRAGLVAAVQAGGEHAPYDALRIAYRCELIGIAALDLTARDPLAAMPATGRALAALAEAALEAALRIARDEHGPEHEACRLAVIGMGKTGGGELNYVSDVDVIFVAEPADGADEDVALRVATQLAASLMRACSMPTQEGALWPVDAALRPEGKHGPLVRTIASHRAYYERWAKTWEFQALLKARHSAGDTEIGARYLDEIAPLVWDAAGRENFVDDVQAMRRRVEEHVAPAEAKRQLKLGPGGLRDVEFSVQLLQLVHGRTDPSLRSPTTLDALAALSAGGYVARDHAAALDRDYRHLRCLEHRIQLHRLRRTHLMPESPEDLRRLGRSMRIRRDPAVTVLADRATIAREVRRIHERLFYRPLLAAAARLTPDQVGLRPEAARDRLAALGYRDPAGAMRHIEALTAGVSRRAAIQRTLLPVMLGWFADEADPDAGLLSFRRVSDELGTTHWYLKMLRDEGRAAERLAHLLARSRFAADLLIRSPESVRVLGTPTGLVPKDRETIAKRMRAAAGRRDTAEEAMEAVHAMRRHELLRIAFADLTRTVDVLEVGAALTALAGATIELALELALSSVERREETPLAGDLLVVGMGSLGGGEIGYASDADVMYVTRAHPGADETVVRERATIVVRELTRLLGLAGPDSRLTLDADLRPEGKNGPLVRTLESYRTYYERWAQTWEFQALVRATPIVGPADLAADFVNLIDPLRWPEGGLSTGQIRDIRTLKARMESERLPRGADPRTHVKLGPGGLTDVEWTVQLAQLQHAHADPTLRISGTLPALDALAASGHLTESDAASLREAWLLACRLRNAGMLWRGRPVDVVPEAIRDADGVARIIGLGPGEATQLAEEWRRVARRARHAMDFNFYDSPSPGSVEP